MDALVIGGGPAGLMAAEVMSARGLRVTVAEAMPTVGRKFLMAGKSGLNLTMDRPVEEFVAAYHSAPDPLPAALHAFGPQQVQDWAIGLGEPLFAGSTKRVFPKAMKASLLLRKWLDRLNAQGVEIRTRHRCVGWDGDALKFSTPSGGVTLSAPRIIFALGGGSWRKLGSDGEWTGWLATPVVPFAASNVGIRMNWSPYMARFAGEPLKNIALRAGDFHSRGEVVITRPGLEGGGVYTLSPALREGAALTCDLFPDLSHDYLKQRLSGARRKDSITNTLRKVLRLSGAKLALLQEFGRPYPDDLVPLLKNLPVTYTGLNAMDQAISTAGGATFKGVDQSLMMAKRPGVYLAGEMLDWDAPTGGYLLTACLALGCWAGLAACET